MSSVSSIPASPPVATPQVSQPQTSDATNGGDSNVATRAQPAVQVPLPPGQGTRVDQIA
jgi:hypothetical protein